MKSGRWVSIVAVVLSTGGLVYFWQAGAFAPSEDPYGAEFEPHTFLEPEPTDRRAIVPEEAPISSQPSSAGVGAEWSNLNRAAIAMLEAGDLEAAVSAFEECHEAEPDEPVFSSNLAEALARLARVLNEAGEEHLEVPIGYLEQAVQLAPERQDLDQLLKRWKKTATAEENFWTDESAHFLLSYDGRREDVLKRGYYQLEMMLESAYDEFGVEFNHYPVGHGDAKIRVVLYQREEFTEITGVGHWAGGVYDGVVRIPVGEFEPQKIQLERVLRHELVHAFLRSLGGKQVPAWLNEGLAQWSEEGPLEARAARVEAARAKLRGAVLFPLKKLQGSLSTWEDEGEIAIGYAQSLAFVEHLSRWYGDQVLYEMVKGCKLKRSCPVTFESRMGITLESTLADMVQSLQ